MRYLRCVVLLAGMLSTVAPTQAQKIGEVSNCGPPAQIKTGDTWGDATIRGEITPASELRTGHSGKLSASFFDPSFPEQQRELQMLPRSHVRILTWTVAGDPMRERAEVALTEGDLRWIGSATDIATGPARSPVTITVPQASGAGSAGACAVGAIEEIFVSYNPETGRVQVTAAAKSQVEVRNPAGAVVIEDHEIAIVEAGRRPTKERVGADELEDMRRQYQFIGGGRAQSQASNSSLANGEGLKPPDRAGPRNRRGPELEPLKDLPIYQPSTTADLGIEF